MEAFADKAAGAPLSACAMQTDQAARPTIRPSCQCCECDLYYQLLAGLEKILRFTTCFTRPKMLQAPLDANTAVSTCTCQTDLFQGRHKVGSPVPATVATCRLYTVAYLFFTHNTNRFEWEHHIAIMMLKASRLGLC